MPDTIEKIKSEIRRLEKYKNENGKYSNTSFFKRSLAALNGILAGLENCPQGKTYEITKQELENAFFNAHMCTVSPI